MRKIYFFSIKSRSSASPGSGAPRLRIESRKRLDIIGTIGHRKSLAGGGGRGGTTNQPEWAGRGDLIGRKEGEGGQNDGGVSLADLTRAKKGIPIFSSSCFRFRIFGSDVLSEPFSDADADADATTQSTAFRQIRSLFRTFIILEV